MNDRCTNCGAPLTQAGPDVRRGVCQHCGNELVVAIDSAQIAAGMKLDMANADAFMTQLAKSLGHAFGQRTRVHWERGRIVKVELELGKDMFVAVLDIDQVQGQHKKMVRGVALKTTHHPIDVWVGLLHEAIATHVTTNAKAATALAQLRIS
jgi:predicted  nucleic acid-binding Zn-ribbon protein